MNPNEVSHPAPGSEGEAYPDWQGRESHELTAHPPDLVANSLSPSSPCLGCAHQGQSAHSLATAGSDARFGWGSTKSKALWVGLWEQGCRQKLASLPQALGTAVCDSEPSYSRTVMSRNLLKFCSPMLAPGPWALSRSHSSAPRFHFLIALKWGSY